MPAIMVALRPEREAPRRPCQVERGNTNYFSSHAHADTTTALRLQRLRLLGIIGQRADMLAAMAWGEAA